jgi:membrane protease YdiL (CAAX protease family)
MDSMVETYEKKQELCPIELQRNHFFSIIACFLWGVFFVSMPLANCFENGVVKLCVSSALLDMWMVAFVFRFYHSKGWPALNPNKMHPVECCVAAVRGMAQLFLILCAVGILWQKVLPLLGYMFNLECVEQPMVKLLRSNLTNEWQFWGIVLLSVVLAPIAEEVFFRYFLYRSLKLHMLPRRAMPLAAFIFALLHFNLMAFALLLTIGIFLTILYERHGNLMPCILAHGISNYISIVLTVLLS